jgi:hypothetical protein
VNVLRAQGHLSKLGITSAVLAKEGVSAADGAALRRLVEDLLRVALAENRLADAGQIARLQMALRCLLTDEEVAENVTVALCIAELHKAPDPGHSPDHPADFEACLAGS